MTAVWLTPDNIHTYISSWNHTCRVWAIKCWLKFAADNNSSLCSISDHSPSWGCVITGPIIGNLISLKRLHNGKHWSMHVAWGWGYLSCYENTEKLCERRNCITSIDANIFNISHWSCSKVCGSVSWTCLENSEKHPQASWILCLRLFAFLSAREICMYVCMYVYMYVCMYVCVFMYLYMHVLHICT
jgi:hypothetical protein